MPDLVLESPPDAARPALSGAGQLLDGIGDDSGDEFVHRGERRLAVRRWGDRSGQPIFLLHGTPGSRLAVWPDDAKLRQLKVCLVTYDRPGYGQSDPHPGRSVADAAEDVAAIADAFGYARFGVLGRSGGGPHALACAALLPERVERVVCLVGLAPFGAKGLNWLHGMVQSNQRHYEFALRNPEGFETFLRGRFSGIRDDPGRVLGDAKPGAFQARKIRADLALLGGLSHASVTGSFPEALDSPAGWVSDSLAFIKPWGFDPQQITVPTLLWHGVRDVFSPVTHTRWLAERIGSAEVRLSRRSTHLQAVEMQPEAIKWLLGQEFNADHPLR